jgi:phosphoglycolate phosphatase-like HAD superfamily hydrolase
VPALIFDLDGTLVDTVYAHVFAWQRALAEAGLPIDGWRIHRRIGRRECHSGSRPRGGGQRSTHRSRRSASVRKRSWSSAVMSSGQSPNRISSLPAPRNSPSRPRSVTSSATPSGTYSAARRARMLSIGLLSGGYREDELARAGAFRVYRDTSELRESLDELGLLS